MWQHKLFSCNCLSDRDMLLPSAWGSNHTQSVRSFFQVSRDAFSSSQNSKRGGVLGNDNLFSVNNVFWSWVLEDTTTTFFRKGEWEFRKTKSLDTKIQTHLKFRLNLASFTAAFSFDIMPTLILLIPLIFLLGVFIASLRHATYELLWYICLVLACNVNT